MVKQVPDSRLRKYPVPIKEELLPYVKEKCQFGYDRLDSLLVIQSPAINISATMQVTRLSNFLSLQLFTAIPKGADLQRDFCLGRIDDVALVWKCYSRDLKDIIDGRFLYFIKDTGAYAVLFSPLSAPPAPVFGGVYTVWLVENPRLAALYFLLILTILSFITLSLYCVYLQMQVYQEAEEALKQPLEIQQEATKDKGSDVSVDQRITELERENQELKAQLGRLGTNSQD